jgi:dTDP-4-dehydrorhamnose reductase
MRVLVFGAGGQLGRELTALRGTEHHIVGLTRAGCDIAAERAAAAALQEHRPDAVVNCAAWTGVDAAETHREEAFRVNAQGPRLLAEACTEAGMLLCHISTDYVFDGTATSPIPEDAPPHPINVYGESKLAGEVAVREVSERHQIVRTAWLYGQDGPNFVLSVLRQAAGGASLRVVDDQRGAPTWTGHLAPALLRLLERGTPGTYHLTAAGETTWFGFAQAIVATAGLANAVAPISTRDLHAPAPRPAYSVLGNHAWSHLGEPPLPDWREGVPAYLTRSRAGRSLHTPSP